MVDTGTAAINRSSNFEDDCSSWENVFGGIDDEFQQPANRCVLTTRVNDE